MINFGLFTFLLINNIILMYYIHVTDSAVENYTDQIKSEYGDGYGTEWIYFPDGNGVLHYVHLTKPKQDAALAERSYSSLTSNGIQFRLYKNDTTYILLDNRGRAIDDTEQDVVTKMLRSKTPLKLITHGWRSSADIENILNIAKAYIQVQNVNVITVDWSVTASGFIYRLAAGRTQNVGVYVAWFLDALKEEYNVAGDQLHLIGHSLGAHVMGMAAAMTKSEVHRVTGLDPARPWFELPPEDASERLDPSDAKIVDVIHTCAGLLGYRYAIGTVDFFPNKGSAPQPGCERMFKWLHACSHSISFHYFLQSIKHPTIYPACKCETWEDFLDQRCNQTGYMGDSVNENMTGTYYLKTTHDLEPFHFVAPDEESDKIL